MTDMKIIMVTTMTTAPTLLTGEVTRDGGRLGGLDGGRDPADGVPAIVFFMILDIMDQKWKLAVSLKQTRMFSNEKSFPTCRASPGRGLWGRAVTIPPGMQIYKS